MTVVGGAELTPLGRTGWSLWSDAALRGAGFPATTFLELCDEELAAAADGIDARDPATRARYEEVFAAALDRLGKVMGRIAGDGAFREAVTWQNPALVPLCLDYALHGRPRNSRGRQVEHTMASYLQRYALKNDSIGFFGPIGWARLAADDAGVVLEPGPGLLRRRTTYFESWAIDGVAEHVAAAPEAWMWLRPRLDRSAALRGRVLQLPFRRPVTLSTAEVRLLRLCDGTRSVRDITGDPPDATITGRLVDLVRQGVLDTAVTGPLVLRPEETLAAWIETIGDPGARARARAPLDALLEGRAAVAAAAGDPDRLLGAVTALAETFERLTGRTSTRRSGRTYAGRTLVYEDAVRDVDLRIGRRVTDRLAPALGLMLRSAGWLAEAIGARYERMARDLLDREEARTGHTEMPMLRVLTALMPEFGDAGASVRSDVVDAVRAEYQRRWSRALGLEAAGAARRHDVTVEAVEDGFTREFPQTAPTWSGARWHSPDVMLVADGAHGSDGAAALERGDVHFVLGEMHCGCNTLESQLFVGQHPEPDRLRAAAAASGLDRRMVIIPRGDSAAATSRMCRAAAVMLPGHTYLSLGGESFEPPAGAVVLPIAALVVRRAGDDLVVAHAGSGTEYPFLEAVGDPLAAYCTDACRPVDRGRHHPRVTIDRLVVSRECWSFPAPAVEWAFCPDERRRYALARRWRAEQELPERAFVSVPVERKPTAVDFRSLPLVNLLAKSIRRTAGSGPGDEPGAVTLTEMLPDLDSLWLEDARGERYTAELRMIAVRGGDPAQSS